MHDPGLKPDGKLGESARSKPVLAFEPSHQLLGSIPHEERDRSIMLLALDAESPADNSLRLLLRVVFRPIEIRRGWCTRADYYVATTGGTVKVEATNSEVINYTGPSRVEVEYDASIGGQTSGVRKFEPQLKGNLGAINLEIRPGSIERDSTKTFSSGVKFSSEEMLLAPTNLGDAVEWRIDSHRAEKAVRDFPVEDVALEVMLRWKTSIKSGTVQARPSEVSFFDNSKRRLSKFQSIMMAWVLSQRGIKIMHLDGFQVKFVERQNG